MYGREMTEFFLARLAGEFRAMYGREMTEFFLARLARARRDGGAWSGLRLWYRTVVDVTRTAGAERWDGMRSRGGPGSWQFDTRNKGMGGMGSWIDDTRYAARRLARTPLFTVAAVTILALGIGVNTAAFTVVDGMLFRPPPFEDPDRLVSVYQDSDDGEPSSTSFPAYEDMAAMTGVFSGVAATSGSGATWEAQDGPLPVSIEYATASYFPVFGLRPSRGNWFSPEHDQVGEGAYAVVSHRTWSTRMGADPGVIGQTVRLNGQPVTIIGIGPENFNGAGGALTTDFWLSISSTTVGGAFQVANLERRTDHWYDVKARLGPGVSLAQARAAMDGLAERLATEFPELNQGRDITVFTGDEVRFHPEIDGIVFSAGMGLMVLVGMVLLLACSNLANLLLVRGLSRSSEMAVRQALGASRGRVTRLFIIESLLLTTLGGATGLVVAKWATDLVPGIQIPLRGNMTIDVGMDYRVLLFSMVLVVVTGVLFGLAPSIRTARADVAGTLRDDQRTSSAGRGAALLRNLLVSVQVAVCLVLLVGAGLAARSLGSARGVDPGFDVDRVAMIATNLSQGGIPQEESGVIRDELRDRIAAIPGVERVAFTSRLPVMGGGSTTTVIENYEPSTGTGSVELNFAVAGRDYFETMGMPLMAGRTFSREDGPETAPVMVVNETAARRFWAGDAVGGRTRSQGNPDGWRDVVGVVADTRVRSLQELPTPMIYFSAEQFGLNAFYLVVRTDGDPAALIGAMRTALRDVGASLPITRIGTMESHLGEALTAPRTAAQLMGVFSLLALVLASLGIYAVVSFAVARRSAELGIRIALGAARTRIIRMVVGETLVTVGFGLAVGLVAALVAAPLLEGALFGVGRWIP